MFRLLRNYEVEEQAFSFRQDIFDHAEEDKENIANSTNISVKIMCKVIKELWIDGGLVDNSQHMRKGVQSKRARLY